MTLIPERPWHRAEEEGNAQAWTYAQRPDGPMCSTRADFSRELRAVIAAGAAESRRVGR